MVIAATAGTAVVQSATKEDGIVNQAFKITVLIGLALAIGVGIFLLYNLTTILNDVGEAGKGLIRGVVDTIFFDNPLFAPFTFAASAFSGRR
jgi:hypothetical protein